MRRILPFVRGPAIVPVFVLMLALQFVLSCDALETPPRSAYMGTWRGEDIVLSIAIDHVPETSDFIDIRVSTARGVVQARQESGRGGGHRPAGALQRGGGPRTRRAPLDAGHARPPS